MTRLLLWALGMGLLSAQSPELLRARKLYQQTDYSSALAVIESVGSRQTAELSELAGQCHYMKGDFKKAVEDFERAVQLDGTRSTAYHGLGRSWGRRAELANPLMAPSYASRARQAFEKAVALDPHNHEAVNDLFQYYLEAPGFLGGGLDKASALVNKIEGNDPAEVHYALAQIALRRKQPELAERYFRKAVEVAPRQVGRLIDLARFLAGQGKIHESEAIFLQAEQIDPHNPTLLFNRASTYIESKRNLSEARRMLQEYLTLPLTPDDPPREDAHKLLKMVAGGA